MTTTYQELKNEIREIDTKVRDLQRELDNIDQHSIADELDKVFKSLRQTKMMIVKAKLSLEQGR